MSHTVSIPVPSTGLFLTETSDVVSGICWSHFSSLGGSHHLQLLSQILVFLHFTCSFCLMLVLLYHLSLKPSCPLCLSPQWRAGSQSPVCHSASRSLTGSYLGCSPPPLDVCPTSVLPVQFGYRCSWTLYQLLCCDDPRMIYLLASLSLLLCAGLLQGLLSPACTLSPAWCALFSGGGACA